jgi:hypothetical protein
VELYASCRAIAIVGVVAFVTGLGPLLLVYHAVYARWLVYAHGPHFLHWTHAHPLLLVFDQRWGIFAWAPVLWLGVPGLVLLLARRNLRWLSVPFVFCGAFELWSSSAALDYQGGRRLTNLTLLAGLCVAMTLAPAARWMLSRRRRLETALALGLVAAVAIPNASVSIGFAIGKLQWDRPLTSAERFGDGERATVERAEDKIGPLTALPAAWVYAARYRRKPITFPWAAHPMWYARDMRTLDYDISGISFTAPEIKSLLQGFHTDDKAPCLEAGPASVVFSAQWPFATRARLVYDATKPEALTVSSRSFFGERHPWGDRLDLLPGKHRKVFLPIPPGGFDSGINEIDFAHDGADANLCLQGVDFVDDAFYPAALAADESPPVSLWHAESYGTDSSSPSAAMGTLGKPWVVEVHEAGTGHTGYYVGRLGELLAAHLFEGPGWRPRVVTAGTDGWLYEIEEERLTGGTLLARTGHVTLEPNPAVTWGKREAYGLGFHPAIAASGTQLVEVHMAGRAQATLLVRTGTRDGDQVTWGAPTTFGTGYDPAVALDTKGRVVVVAQKESGPSALVVRAGRIDGADVTWGEPVEQVRGSAPALAGYGDTVIETHQEDDALVLDTGVITDTTVAWHTRKSYDHGAHPRFAVDAATGHAIEVHEGTAGSRELWMHDADVR